MHVYNVAWPIRNSDMLCFFYLKLQLAAKKKKTPKSPKTGGKKKQLAGEEKRKPKKATRSRPKKVLTPEEVVAKQLKTEKAAMLPPAEVSAKRLKAENAANRRLQLIADKHKLTLCEPDFLDSEPDECEYDRSEEYSDRKRMRRVQ